MENTRHKQCAELIQNCDALIINSGAGFGVDSGMPDFRGSRGWWKRKNKVGLGFQDLANPRAFRKHPNIAWGFYGYRLNMYRKVEPHDGFRILLKWIQQFDLDYFCITSNVDGHFQKAGYEEEHMYEVHGSIHYLQCSALCTEKVWKNEEEFEVNEEIMESDYLPKCPHCGLLSRPNILMFGDYNWISRRYGEQSERLQYFLEKNIQEGKRIVIIEVGAGTTVATIRYYTETLSATPNTTAIRINPEEEYISPPHISIAEGALECLRKIDTLIEKK